MGLPHYRGSELYITIADSKEPPYPDGLKQLGVKLLCSNGDLPLRMRAGTSGTEFVLLRSGDPVKSVRCLHGPTRPRASCAARGELAARLIAYLSINYHSLIDGGNGEGPAALRRLLALYADLDDPAALKQIEEVVSVSQKPIAVRLWSPGPIVFGRGIEVTITLDDQAFEGGGPFLFGAVLQRFLDRYREINSLIETVIKTPERGEIGRWKPRTPKPQTRV